MNLIDDDTFNNFSPIFQDYWNRPDLQAYEIEWLFRDIRPEDATKALRLTAVSKKSTEKVDHASDKEQDVEWLKCFYKYLRHIRCYHWDNIRAIDFSNNITKFVTKEQYVQFLYNRRMYLDENFMEFLISNDIVKVNPALEKWQDHSRFEFKYKSVNSSEIKNERCALFLLFNLDIRIYDKYSNITNKFWHANEEAKCLAFSPEGMDSLSDEEVWLWNEYRLYLFEKYGHEGAIYSIMKEIANLGLWGGDIKAYAHKLYDNGYIFDNKIYNVLGIVPEYTKDSPILELYNHWCKMPAWSFEQACYLFIGEEPKIDYVTTSYSMLSRVKITTIGSSIFSRDNSSNEKEKSIKLFNFRISQENIMYMQGYYKSVDMYKLLALSEAVGDCTSYEFNPNYDWRHLTYAEMYNKPPKEHIKVYKPQDIVKWLFNNTEIAPPKLLIDCLFSDDVDLKDELLGVSDKRKEYIKSLHNQTVYRTAKDWQPFLTEVSLFVYSALLVLNGSKRKKQPSKVEIIKYIKEVLNKQGIKYKKFSDETLSKQIAIDSQDLRYSGNNTINDLQAIEKHIIASIQKHKSTLEL